MTEDANSIPPEFSRPVPVGRLSGQPAHFTVAAGPAERAALAERLDIRSVDRLQGEVTLRREPGGGIRFDAVLEATVTQSCVVTLDPVSATLTDRFTLLYRADIDEAEADRLALENPEDETIEPLIGESIDIGEALAQQLSIVLDPYPRAPGAVPEPGDAGEAGAKPFDILARFAKRS
jgi:hypothetical protein